MVYFEAAGAAKAFCRYRSFRDGSQALADGRLDKDGVFRAGKIQAKCASKYEAKPGQMPGQAPSNINTGKRGI